MYSKATLDRAKNAIYSRLAWHYLQPHRAAERASNIVQALGGGANEDEIWDMLRCHLPFGTGRLNAVFEIRYAWVLATSDTLTEARVRLVDAGMPPFEVEPFLAQRENARFLLRAA